MNVFCGAGGTEGGGGRGGGAAPEREIFLADESVKTRSGQRGAPYALSANALRLYLPGSHTRTLFFFFITLKPRVE